MEIQTVPPLEFIACPNNSELQTIFIFKRMDQVLENILYNSTLKVHFEKFAYRQKQNFAG